MEKLSSANENKYELINKAKNVKVFGLANASIQEEFESPEYKNIIILKKIS